MTPDFFNGLFEFAGSIMLWLNVIKLYKDKQLRGYSVWATVFFTSWGIWNLFYYPSLNQWWSFAGGISIALANCVWLALMIRYRKN